MDRRPARLAGTRSKLAILTVICVCIGVVRPGEIAALIEEWQAHVLE